MCRVLRIDTVVPDQIFGVTRMADSRSNTIQQLLRLANDSSLDAQSRRNIRAMARYIMDLQGILNKTRDLDLQLKALTQAADQRPG